MANKRIYCAGITQGGGELSTRNTRFVDIAPVTAGYVGWRR